MCMAAGCGPCALPHRRGRQHRQIPRLEKLVATIRSREVSACLVLQAQSQLKAIYKDNADTIIGNMDATVFLGGKEPTTLKELAASLGKETIDTYNTGESVGGKPPTLSITRSSEKS